MANTRDVSMRLVGAKELEYAMRILPTTIANRIVPTALRGAAKPIVQSARWRLSWNKRTGELAKSIGTKLAKKRSDAARVMIVGPRSKKTTDSKGRPVNPANYAHLVEYGTQAHTITPRIAAVGVGGVLGPFKGSEGFAAKVEHPGADAQPFLRPAFDSKKNQAANNYLAFATKAIEREAAKLNKPK